MNEADEMQVYPNPATESVILQLSSFASGDRLQISDINGRIMKELSPVSSTTSIQLNELNKGYYIFTLYQKSRVYRKSILKL